MQTWISLPFGDGEYLFRLGTAQIVELERKCDAGLGLIYARTRKGRFGFEPDKAMPDEGEYRWLELVEIIRQLLIGGASGVVDRADVLVTPTRANQLIDTYLLAHETRLPTTQIWALAYAGLSALIEGYEPPKKAEPGESPAT